MVLTQSVGLTPEVTQQALHKRSGSPTRPVPPDVATVPRASCGTTSRSYFPRGFFPGWLSSASFPLVLGIMQTTSSQVSFPFPSSSILLPT